LDEKHLLASGVWQMAQRIGKWRTKLTKFSTLIWRSSAISELVKLNSEYFTEHFVLATFYLVHKAW